MTAYVYIYILVHILICNHLHDIDAMLCIQDLDHVWPVILKAQKCQAKRAKVPRRRRVRKAAKMPKMHLTRGQTAPGGGSDLQH